MAKKLNYEDYCDYFALKCKICYGQRYLLINDVWTSCICQHTATVKWRLEEFDVHPPELKYKTWDDFIGLSIDGNHQLTDSSFVSAKRKALKYCFGSEEMSVIENRNKTLCVQNHLDDGQNFIISGPKHTGKTLIAVLIIKEVAYASRFFNLNLGFKCIKSNALCNAARWDNHKQIDHALLDELSEIEFLVIDEVCLPEGGHNTPPDVVALNNLFDQRVQGKLPTVITCNNGIFLKTQDRHLNKSFTSFWGNSFASLMMMNSNVFVDLEIHG